MPKNPPKYAICSFLAQIPKQAFAQALGATRASIRGGLLRTSSAPSIVNLLVFGYNRPMDVILTHEHTDFDALASLLAAAKLHPEAVPVLPRQMNRNLRDFLALYEEEFPFVEARKLRRRRISRALLVDTQSAMSLKGMGPHTPVQVIDHHPRNPNLNPAWEFWGEELGATTTLLVEQMVKAKIPLTPIEATLLLLGIYEDTGSLGYTSTTARDVRSAAWLLDWKWSMISSTIC
jgi:tRNA nucleotidyltransferase (CCA-adding enzyme)